jgi:hypothetical protein
MSTLILDDDASQHSANPGPLDILAAAAQERAVWFETGDAIHAEIADPGIWRQLVTAAAAHPELVDEIVISDNRGELTQFRCVRGGSASRIVIIEIEPLNGTA